MVTSEDLLAIPGVEINAVHLSAVQVPVRWVATSELRDPTPFLEGGELVLTTGLEMAGWRYAEWYDYVDRLINVGVAALALGTGLTHEGPPDALTHACRELDLTLIEVPRDTPFIAISLAVADLLREAVARAERSALDMQHALTLAALQLDLSHLLDRLASLLIADCTLLRQDGSLFLRASAQGASEVDLNQAAAEVARMQGHGFRTSSTVSDATGMLTVRPIGLTGRPGYYLATRLADATSEPARSTLVTASALLSLAVERLDQRRAADGRLTARAVDLLLLGDLRTARVLVDATELRLRISPRVRVVCAEGPAPDRTDFLAASQRARDLVAVRDDIFIGIVPDGRADSLAEQAASHGLLVGIGRLVPSSRTAQSHETAVHALAKSTPEVPIRRWDDLAEQGPMGLIPAGVAKSFAESLLGNLDEEQVGTLEAYLRHNGSRGAMAKELGVHRNTVRNRVSQIEQLLGATLADPHTRAAAWIALQVMGGQGVASMMHAAAPVRS